VLICVSLTELVVWYQYPPAHLSIHDTLTATLDSGMCKSGGGFGVTTYS
jgi:hypothetical protein